MVRVGLLGCGRIARYFHLRALVEHPDVDLAVVADPSAEAREAAGAAAPGTRLEADWTRVIADRDVDAVVVCLPTDLHVAAAVAALEAGIAVYVEKPVAIDADGLEALRAARAAAPGVVASAGLNFRHHPLYEAAGRTLAAGDLGRLLTVRTTFAAAPRDLPVWKRSRATGGGALLDLATHHVDLVRLLLGEVTTVSASVRTLRTDADTATFTLGLADGLDVQGLVTLSGVQQDRIEVLGDAGEMVLDRYRSPVPQLRRPLAGDGRAARARGAGRELGRAVAAARGVAAPPADPSFAAALGAFVGAVASGAPAAPTLEDGMRSLEVVLAAERSAAEAAPVTLDAPGPGVTGAP